MPGTESRLQDNKDGGLQSVRCDTCKRPLPVKMRLTPGSVVSFRCRHCTETTVRVGQPPPHWG